MKKIIAGLLFALSLAFIGHNALAQTADSGDSGQADCTTLTYTLKLGSRDSRTEGQVTDLQAFLQATGYLSSDPTGYFGNVTKAAVMSFQKAYGLVTSSGVATGVVGITTRQMIQQLSCTTSGSTSNPVSTNTDVFQQAAQQNFQQQLIATSTNSSVSVIQGGLSLAYTSTAQEAALKARFAVSATAGASALNINKLPGSATGGTFYIDLISNSTGYSANVNSGAAPEIFPQTTNVIDNGSYWTIPAGQTAKFSASKSYIAKQLFAGSYYAKLTFSSGGQNLFVTNAQTASVTVVGEVSPYVSNVTTNANGTVTVTGARLNLNDNYLEIDGQGHSWVNKFGGTSTSFTFDPTTWGLSQGMHTLQIVNGVKGDSNKWGVTIGSPSVSSAATLEFLDTPKLLLTYSNGKEASLVGTTQVKLTIGSLPIRVYTNQVAQAILFSKDGSSVGSNSMSYAATCSGLSALSINTLQPGTSYTCSIANTVKAGDLFAGTYSMKPSNITYNNDGSDFGYIYASNFINGASSNTVTIVGETSPYISSVTSDSQGQITITGARLNLPNNGVTSDGYSIGYPIAKAQPTSITFKASSFGISSGGHVIKITNATAGDSNSYYVNASSSQPLPPVISLTQTATTTKVGDSWTVSWSAQNVTGCTFTQAIGNGSPVQLSSGITGSQTFYGAVANTYTYAVSCNGSNGGVGASQLTHTTTYGDATSTGGTVYDTLITSPTNTGETWTLGDSSKMIGWRYPDAVAGKFLTLNVTLLGSDRVKYWPIYNGNVITSANGGDQLNAVAPWSGLSPNQNIVPDGKYTVVVSAYDSATGITHKGESGILNVANASSQPSAPVITSITPTSGPVGTSLTITGTGFTSNNNVRFWPSLTSGLVSEQFNIPASGCSSNGCTTITLTVPATLTNTNVNNAMTPGTYYVSVKNSNGSISNLVTFAISAPAVITPTVSSVSPTSGKAGDTITIFGSGFSTTGNSVFLDYTSSASSWSSIGSNLSSNGSSITLTIPSIIGCPVYRSGGVGCSTQSLSPIPSGGHTISVYPPSSFVGQAIDGTKVSNTVPFSIVSTTLTPSGTVSASSCTVQVGASTCTTNVTWSTSNLPSDATVSLVQSQGDMLTVIFNGSASNQLSGPVSQSLRPGSYTYKLSANGTVLATTPITVSCATGSTWNGSSCQANVAPEPVTTTNYNFVASTKDACESSITSRLGITSTCSIGGGCTINGNIPSTTYPSANPNLWGACITPAMIQNSTSLSPKVSVTQTSTSTKVGDSWSVSWTSTNATACTYEMQIGSGSWTQMTSGTTGTQSYTGAVANTYNYRVTCSGASGTVPAVSTVTHTTYYPLVVSPTGTISASRCLISEVGGTKCSTTVSWSTQNTSTAQVTKVPKGDAATVLSTSLSSVGTLTDITQGSTDFILSPGNGGSMIAQTTATAECGVGLTWGGTFCQPISPVASYTISSGIVSIVITQSSPLSGAQYPIRVQDTTIDPVWGGCNNTGETCGTVPYPSTFTFACTSGHTFKVWLHTLVGTTWSNAYGLADIQCPITSSLKTMVLGVQTQCVELAVNLHRGYEIPAVSKLQAFLQAKGMLGDVTGFYGDKTVAAVKMYQESRGLPQTGMVYGATRAAIAQDSCQ